MGKIDVHGMVKNHLQSFFQPKRQFLQLIFAQIQRSTHSVVFMLHNQRTSIRTLLSLFLDRLQLDTLSRFSSKIFLSNKLEFTHLRYHHGQQHQLIDERCSFGRIDENSSRMLPFFSLRNSLLLSK